MTKTWENMVRNRSIYGRTILVTVVTLGICGCSRTNPLQEAWHNKHRCFISFIDGLSEHNLPPLSERHLFEFLREPDYKVTPPELAQLLVKDQSYREHVMDSLWSEYCCQKVGLSDTEVNNTPSRWQDSEAFLNCSLWIYDETRRFPEPPPCSIFCADFGFIAHIFIIENAKIMGERGFSHWKPLADNNNRKRH